MRIDVGLAQPKVAAPQFSRGGIAEDGLPLAVSGESSVAPMARLALRSENQEFELVWAAEIRFTRDAITSATAIALGTSSIRVGTSAINVFTRGPAMTAVTMSGFDDWSPGRSGLGILHQIGAGLAAWVIRYDWSLTLLHGQVAAVRSVMPATDADSSLDELLTAAEDRGLECR